MSYELLDYSYHILSVHSHDTLTGTHPSATSATAPAKPSKTAISTVTTTSSTLDHASQKITDPRVIKAVDVFVMMADEQKQLQSELFCLFQAKVPTDHETIKVVVSDELQIPNVDKFSQRHVAVELELSHGFVLYHPPPLNEIA